MTFFDLDIELTPPSHVLEMDFRELGVDIRSFREPLTRSVREVISPSIRRNFDVGGRPSWAPLSDVTWLRRDGAGEGPLVRTGLLKQVAGQMNVWDIGSEEAVVAGLPRAEYGVFHQSGTSRMPERPFMMIQDPEDLDDIELVFFKWLQERFGERGFDIGDLFGSDSGEGDE